MAKKKRGPKFKKRREFDRTAFKTSPRRDRVLQCIGNDGVNYGHINVSGIERMFPNREERLEYINALIAKMEEGITEGDEETESKKENVYTQLGLHGLMAMAERAGIRP